ncbi:hypothetical protein pb186bvf_004086 [Paramecium bursaria]
MQQNFQIKSLFSAIQFQRLQILNLAIFTISTIYVAYKFKNLFNMQNLTEAKQIISSYLIHEFKDKILKESYYQHIFMEIQYYILMKQNSNKIKQIIVKIIFKVEKLNKIL